MSLSAHEPLVFGWVAMIVVMTIAWGVQQWRRDAGVVDVAWSANLGVLALFYSVTGENFTWRVALVAALASLWSFRLAGYLLVHRVLGKEEDGRYQKLRQRWGTKAPFAFFVFFQVQGLLDVVFSLSFLAAMRNPASFPTPWDLLAVGVWILAVAGETAADQQLARHRADPRQRGKTCRAGLWRYSRHPNYFFEWVHWWTYPLFAIGSNEAWLTLIAPALMLFFLLRVTGIPATEAQALATRGDDYRQYQQTTSPFIPWFPKTLGGSRPASD